MDEDVSELEIAVHHLLLIDLLESRHQLLKDDPCLQLSEASPTELFEVLEVAAIAKLHDQVKIILCPRNVVQLYHMWTLDFCQDVDLVFEVVEETGCETRLLDDLYSEALLGIVLFAASVHLAELPLAERFGVNQIIRDRLHYSDTTITLRNVYLGFD